MQISQLIRKWMDRGEDARTPKDAHARFQLVYGGVPVGNLSVREGQWTFQYTDEFRERSDLRPIVEFPDVSKTYVSEELWPFFAMRIPSLSQSNIRGIIAHEHIDETDDAALLRRFGKTSVSTPYQLFESESAES